MQLKSSLTALLATTLIVVTSCSKNETDPPIPTVIFSTILAGSNEVPANLSTATGTAVFTFNKNTKILSGVINYTGIAPVAGHIHKAAAGTNGGVIFPFAAPLTSPINYTSAPFTEAQEADLFAGLNYVNLHTPARPGGEIRGQLIQR
jgi:CHRD domain